MAGQPKSEKPLKKCFVIGPIGDQDSDTRNRADWFLEIVNAGLESFDYEIVRADKMQTPGLITEQVINAISDADLVVADLTDYNPNVFYELAIRHREEKPVVHMISADQRPPFDLADIRVIFYDLKNPRLVKQAAEDLGKQVEETEKSGYKVSNPITRARGVQELTASSDSVEQLVLGLRREINELIIRTYNLELLSGQVVSLSPGVGLHSGATSTIPWPPLRTPPVYFTVAPGEPNELLPGNKAGPPKKKKKKKK